VAVGTTVDNRDVPNPPIPLDIDYMVYSEMEVVYQSPKNMEVLSDTDGKLWVCDDAGDIYDYAEFTEAYGEIDGDVPARKTGTAHAVIV
jgi:hypothetical protein